MGVLKTSSLYWYRRVMFRGFQRLREAVKTRQREARAVCSRAPSAMTKWFRWLLMGILASAGAWWTLFVNEYVPGPERAVLMLEEVWEGQPQAVDGRFRIVLCWLDNDPRGHNTRYVAQAFTSVEGVTLARLRLRPTSM